MAIEGQPLSFKYLPVLDVEIVKEVVFGRGLHFGPFCRRLIFWFNALESSLQRFSKVHRTIGKNKAFKAIVKFALSSERTGQRRAPQTWAMSCDRRASV